MRCPAAAGLIRCPLKPDSMNRPYTTPTAYPDAGLQAPPPPCCSQTTVSVPVEIQSSTRQKRTWGSEEWFDTYARHRPAVESFFSLIKDPGKEHMARGRIKMMGIARTSIMVAFWTAAANYRLIDAWERNATRQDHGVTVVSRPSRRHRAISWAHQEAVGTDPPPVLSIQPLG